MRVRDGLEISLEEQFLSSDMPSQFGVLANEAYWEPVVPKIQLDQLDELIIEVTSSFDRYDTAIDGSMVEPLHRALPLSRRLAADSRIWAWLGVVRYPDFVAYRWRPHKEVRNQARFFGDRVRQCFSRLWWAAEVSRDGDNYELTHRLLALPGFQDIYEAVFGRTFGNYRPALEAFVEVVGNRPEDFIRDFAKELGYVLTTTTLECMDKESAKDFMEWLKTEIDGRPIK